MVSGHDNNAPWNRNPTPTMHESNGKLVVPVLQAIDLANLAQGCVPLGCTAHWSIPVPSPVTFALQFIRKRKPVSSEKRGRRNGGS